MITIYDWFGYELPIKKRYQLIKDAGFDGVLLWWSDGFGRGNYRSGPQIIVIKLIKEIINKILYVFRIKNKKYKYHIMYLLQALHNLPKVYLNTDATTLFNIGIKPINNKEALEYANFYLKLDENLSPK